MEREENASPSTLRKPIGAWSLVFLWCLELGIWSFGIRSWPTFRISRLGFWPDHSSVAQHIRLR